MTTRSWYENLGDGIRRRTLVHRKTLGKEGPLERSLWYRSVVAYDANLDGTVEVFGRSN